MKRRITQQDTDKIVELYKGGKDMPDIRQELSVSLKVISDTLVNAGLTDPPEFRIYYNGPDKDDIDKKIIAYAKSGEYLICEIPYLTGADIQHVRGVLQKNNCTRHQLNREKGLPYGQERVDVVCDLRHQGYSYGEIKTETGIDICSIARISRENGLGGKAEGHAHQEAEQRVVFFTQCGFALEDIMEFTGFGRQRIYNILEKHGVERPLTRNKQAEAAFLKTIEDGTPQKEAAEKFGYNRYKSWRIRTGRKSPSSVKKQK